VSCGVALKNDVVPALAHDNALPHHDRAIRLIAFPGGLVAKRARPRKERGLCPFIRLYDGRKFRARLGPGRRRAQDSRKRRQRQDGEQKSPIAIVLDHEHKPGRVPLFLPTASKTSS
jgi:hypothetical protein